MRIVIFQHGRTVHIHMRITELVYVLEEEYVQVVDESYVIFSGIRVEKYYQGYILYTIVLNYSIITD